MIHQIHKKILLPISIDDAWAFFSDPGNLPVITPPKLDMKIINELESTTYPGQIITYSISLFFGVRATWVTEITHLEKPHYFVDEQRYGPYRMWHHQHRFASHEHGTVVEDIVDYIMPFGIFGELARALYVKKELETIFNYRSRILAEKFGILNQ